MTLTPNKLSCGCCESGKKSSDAGFQAGAADSLEAFLERLRELCVDHGTCDGDTRLGEIKNQARCAHALARELGILKRSDDPWERLDVFRGSEHLVELDSISKRAVKLTIPPGFGLMPLLTYLPVVDLRSEKQSSRTAVEFFPATPIEYLERWQAANEVFGDDVRLASVIEWPDGGISFCLTQPQYHGAPAEPRDIDAFFLNNGWTRLKDPSGHVVYFNYALGIMAIDAERRNCYLTNGELQPFDVILCRPDEDMERFLGIYPS
ncbi:hypothetical protein OKA05_05370 [Luteolibacter arcticus]|uniref:Uncharacterized protein n=1 Tax=Luteolibacter arcticus TaxID=1581411 RepID=A0ABT3GEC5_9BACT|nr:hypothetical protein [Luteolibacter arcticus]MCW1921971.1 hypothetical protein [Luteolibacter arcticus]